MTDPARPILFRAARLIDPAARTNLTGDLLVQDGVIADIQAQIAPPDGAEIVEAKGLVLAPGLIDMRTHLREPGEEYKETIGTAAEAAVAGGITTLACLADTDPVTEDPSQVAYLARRGNETGKVHVLPYGAATKGRAGNQLTEMALLSEAGAVGFTDAPHALSNALVMRRAFAYARTFDFLLLNHPEEPSLTSAGAMTEGEIATRLGLAGIPPIAETIMVERDLHLAELTGARYHAGPLTTAQSIEAVRRAKARGVRVTADTAPHYFALNETAVGDYRTFAKVSPPLRSEGDRRAVVEGLADGTIDAIASDHAPHNQDSKRLPFAQAAFGIIGLETLLPLTLELVHNKHLNLVDAIARLTLGPANILRQETGRLTVGAPADLVLIDLDRPWRIDERVFRSKSKNSPFDGRPVQGYAVATYFAGRQVYRRGTA